MSNKYHMDGHKLYWHLDRVLQWQSGETVPPIYVEVSPVSYCNHRCVFCGLDFAQKEQHALDADLLCTRLEEMGRLGVKSIMLAGEGEPLLHKELPRIVATAKGAGIDVSITTNGTVGSIELWEKLLPHLSWLRFSMDAGSAGVYAQVHRVDEQTFEKTCTSIRDALAVRKQGGYDVTIGVQYLLIAQNLDDVGAAIETFDRIGVDYLSFKPYSEHPQMHNKSGFTYTQAMLSRVEQVVESRRPETKTELIYRKAAAENYAGGDIGFTACRALPFWGYISSKGEFHTCSVFLNDDRFKVGDIYTESMEEILFGAARRESIRYGSDALAVNDECRLNCRMARINEFLDHINRRPEHSNFI